ncbi:hypothetical protein BU15DRAFT_76573 [Melanogaster broomeanus]|nr:hypothetical protein BU15DRAFT_76573 [Melanogaster broomeanus]
MSRVSRTQPEEKKETHKKKTPQQDRPPKKAADSGIWPCNIDGCNKQFAREADLKRHQRTTKLHSIPGFACPQCDARFTRTDALRRHQKSRHNGVVIEPTDVADRKKALRDDHPQSSGSKSKSRSISPSLKDKESPSASSGPASSLPSTSAPPPQSYYRQHTLPAGVLMPPPGMMVDGHYPSGIALPTSATRLHQATWPPPPHWGGDGPQPPPPPPHMIHIGYTHPYYNTTPPYYRPGMMQHPADLVPPQHIQNGVGSPGTGESSSSRTGSPVMANMAVGPSGLEREADTETGEGEASVIDPSLVSPSASSADSSPVSMEITQAAVEAVLKSAGRESSANSQASGVSDTAGSSPGHGHQQVSSHTSGEEGEENTDRDPTVVQDLPLSSHAMSSHNPSYSSSNGTPLERPPEMEQILTEDGEPMLNPAELLTQESLASPPPS